MTKSSHWNCSKGVEVLGEMSAAFAEILTTDAIEFVAKLQRTFSRQRGECLQRRQERRAALDRGEALSFLSGTKEIREGDWKCAAIPRRYSGSAGRDHGTNRSQDDHQCAELGRDDLK